MSLEKVDTTAGWSHVDQIEILAIRVPIIE
jgi:hypothetical protein